MEYDAICLSPNIIWMLNSFCGHILTGLEAICYGCQAVDPVSGNVAPVVGARLDLSRKTVVPLTAAHWLMMAEHLDSAQVSTYSCSVSIC